jgi:hypothetical protein
VATNSRTGGFLILAIASQGAWCRGSFASRDRRVLLTGGRDDDDESRHPRARRAAPHVCRRSELHRPLPTIAAIANNPSRHSSILLRRNTA